MPTYTDSLLYSNTYVKYLCMVCTIIIMIYFVYKFTHTFTYTSYIICVYIMYNRHKSHPKCRVHPCTEASGFPSTRPRTVRGKLMTPRCSQSFLHVVFGAVQWPQAKEFSASVSSFQAARSANFANRLTSRNMSFFQCFLHTNQNLHFSRFRFSFPLFPETLFKAANHSRRPIQFAGPGVTTDKTPVQCDWVSLRVDEIWTFKKTLLSFQSSHSHLHSVVPSWPNSTIGPR